MRLNEMKVAIFSTGIYELIDIEKNINNFLANIDIKVHQILQSQSIGETNSVIVITVFYEVIDIT